jgi:hypothetical protein
MFSTKTLTWPTSNLRVLYGDHEDRQEWVARHKCIRSFAFYNSVGIYDKVSYDIVQQWGLHME